METAAEWYCVLKTSAEGYPALEQRLKSLHSYAIPEIIAIPLEPVSGKYADWVMESIQPNG